MTKYIKPADTTFTDSADHWLLFRRKRFTVAGDGEYAVLRRLDLSEIKLHDFVVPWLVFDECKLDGVSFRNTDFTFKATFINCPMKGVDFTGSWGGDDLFYRCDFTGAIFDRANHWASIDLDHRKIPSYFIDCVMSEELRDFLIQDGNKVIGREEMPPYIHQRVKEALEAPEVDLAI